MVRQAREMIEAGKIGEIVYVTTEYPQDWLLLGLRDEETRKKNVADRSGAGEWVAVYCGYRDSSGISDPCRHRTGNYKSTGTL